MSNRKPKPIILDNPSKAAYAGISLGEVRRLIVVPKSKPVVISCGCGKGKEA